MLGWLRNVVAEAATLAVYDSTSQVPRMDTTYFLHSFFFLLGSDLGTYVGRLIWQLCQENINRSEIDLSSYN